MIKKIIALVSCLVIVFAFSACGDKDDKASNNSDSTTTTESKQEDTSEETTDASYEVDTTEPQESNVNIKDGVLESSNYSVDVGDDWDMTLSFSCRKRVMTL